MNRSIKKHSFIFLTTIFSVVFFILLAPAAILQGVNETEVNTIREKIINRSSELQNIQKEIQEYEQKLKEVGSERQTLESTVKTLDATRGKLQSEIKLTNYQIGKTDSQIQDIEVSINEMVKKMEHGKEAVVASLQKVDEIENQSVAEVILSGSSFSELWESVEELTAFQVEVNQTVQALADTKRNFEDAQRAASEKREELAKLEYELRGEKGSLDATRQAKNQILDVTKNKESNYQSLLADKRAAQQQMEGELRALETALKIAIDPNKFPSAGTKVLVAPIPGAIMTQGYGLTSFAVSGAYGYSNGQPNPHRGIDYGVPTGTPIKAPLSGVVKGIENMDAYPGCYSFGRWIVVEHPNGLSSLYAHLSSFAVSQGQQVQTGQILGYSGNSGYSTNPHLHFGLYATEGVRIQKYTTSNGCKQALVPLAAPEAYLNPLNYM